jgi:hypothetical protein
MVVGHRIATGNAFHTRRVKHSGGSRQGNGKTVSSPIRGVVVVVHPEAIDMDDQKCKFRHSGIIAHSAPVGS